MFKSKTRKGLINFSLGTVYLLYDNMILLCAFAEGMTTNQKSSWTTYKVIPYRPICCKRWWQVMMNYQSPSE